MKTRNIVIAAFLLALAGTYIYLFEIPAGEKVQKAQKPFSGLSQKNITAVTLRNNKNGDQAIRFSNNKLEGKSGFDSWGMEGVEYPALDSTNFGTIINQLIAYDLGKPLPASELDSDLGVYGLSNPEADLTVETDQQAKFQFSFGKRSDFIGKRYVSLARTDGSKDLFVTDDLLFFAVDKLRDDFRNKSPINIKDADQKKLIIKSSNFSSELRLEKLSENGQEIWKIKSPYQASAEEQKVTDVMRQLKNLKVQAFIENGQVDEFKDAVNHPLVEIQLFSGLSETAQAETIRLTKKSAEDKNLIIYWSKYPSTYFQVEDDKILSQFGELDAYRKVAFFKPDAFSVKNISVDYNGESVVKAEKKDEVWNLSGNPQIDGKPADHVFIEEYLQDLAKVSAIEFPEVNESDFGFDKPRLKLVIDLEGQSGQRSFVVGKEVAFEDGHKGYFAAVDDLSEPFIIGQAGFDKLMPRPGAWVLIPTPTAAQK